MQYEKIYKQDLMQDAKLRMCGHLVYSGDNQSVVVRVQLYRDGEEYTGGGSVLANAVLPNGNTVALTGTMMGNVASVTLLESCFVAPGPLGLYIRVVNGDEVTTVFSGIFNAVLTSTSTPVDPGDVVPDINTLLSMIATMQQATQTALDAADDAEGAAELVAGPLAFKEDALGYLSDTLITTDDENYELFGDATTGHRWSFSTDSEGGSAGKYYYGIYHIPSGTKLIGVAAYHYTEEYAGWGFYSGYPGASGSEIISSLSHATGAIAKTAVAVPEGADYMVIQLGAGATTRGVYPFTSTRYYAEQALHMVNQTIHTFTKMKTVLPCSSSPDKASFDEAVLGVVYFIGFTPVEEDFVNIVGMPERKSGSLLTVGAYSSYTAGATQVYITSADSIYVRTKISNTWRAWHKIPLQGEMESAIAAAIATAVPKEVEYHVGAGREYTSFVSLLMQLDGDETPKVIYIDQGTYDIYAEYVASSVPEPPDPDSTSGTGFADYNVVIPKNTRVIGIGDVTFDFQLPKTIAYHTSRIWSCLNLVYGNTTVENLTLHCKNCRYGIHDESDNAYTGYTNYYRNVRIIMEEADRIEDTSNPHYNEKLGYGPAIGFGFEDKTTYIFENCHFTDYCNNGNVSAFYGHDGSSVGGTKVLATNCIFETFTGTGDPATTNTSCIRMQSIRDWTSGTSRANVATFNNCYATGGIRLQNYGGSDHSGGSDHGGMWDVVLLHSGNPAQTIDEAKRTGKVSVYE